MLQIVKDFCQWIENLGGMEKSQMTEDTVQQLFEVGFNTPAARAICVRFKELPAVTESAAQARNLPKVSIIIKPGCSDHKLVDPPPPHFIVILHCCFFCDFFSQLTLCRNGDVCGHCLPLLYSVSIQ